jgi:hypothetical protein
MPDVSTEVAIATTTLTSTVSSITFSSIPSTYTDLKLVFVVTGVGAVRIQPNSDAGARFSTTVLLGNGSAASSTYNPNTSFGINLAEIVSPSSTVPTLYTADIFSYAGSTFKTILGTGNGDRNGSGEVGNLVGLWRDTTAISSIKIDSNGNDYYAGSTATLYGIL